VRFKILNLNSFSLSFLKFFLSNAVPYNIAARKAATP
jgi:hypothetical protein